MMQTKLGLVLFYRKDRWKVALGNEKVSLMKRTGQRDGIYRFNCFSKTVKTEDS